MFHFIKLAKKLQFENRRINIEFLTFHFIKLGKKYFEFLWGFFHKVGKKERSWKEATKNIDFFMFHFI